MAKHNYSQYSNKKNDNKVDVTPEVTAENQNENVTTVVEEVETIIENKTITDTDVIVETVENKSIVESKSAAVAKGVVANCAKLNVRSKPSTKCDVITVLNVGDEVSIDVDNSTEEWFKIRTINDNVKGYCMRKFVSANI